MSPFFNFCDPEMWASFSFSLPPLHHAAPNPAHLIFFPIHLFSTFPAIILGQENNIPYLNYFKCYSIFLPLGSLQFIYHTTAEVMFAKHFQCCQFNPSVPSHCSQVHSQDPEHGLQDPASSHPCPFF